MNNCYYILDTILVLGTVIDTHTTLHSSEPSARSAFAKSLDDLYDTKYLVRLLKIVDETHIEQIAHYRSAS